MSLQKYDVIKTMIPFQTIDDQNNGHKTLSFDTLLEAQLSGNYKYNRPCVVLGKDKTSNHVILAEMRSNRDKPFRSNVNDIDVAGIDHESAILIAKNQLIYVEPDLIPVIEPDKCGHLSDDDIKRFENEFIRVNFKQQLKPKAPVQTKQTSPSDKQLLSKLEQVETETISTSNHQSTPELC